MELSYPALETIEAGKMSIVDEELSGAANEGREPLPWELERREQEETVEDQIIEDGREELGILIGILLRRGFFRKEILIDVNHFRFHWYSMNIED